VMVDGVLRVDCPTDQFKRSVRKVVIEFGDPSPELPKFPGLVADTQVGPRRELVFVGFGPEQQAAIEDLAPRHLEIIEMNLEDAFIEYTRGARRPLPMLREEHSSC
jgi:ABC-2 type transport system ATP-binding protein